MRDYARKMDWVLEDVSFYYVGGRYRGRGLLTWRPDSGFHLEAFVTRSGPPVPSPLILGAVRLATKQDRTSIRMQIQYGGLAYTLATLADRFDVLHQGRLSARLGVVRFMRRLPEVARKATRWSGSALIKLPRSILWPDSLTRTVHLNDQKISESFEHGGLLHETDTLRVRGQEDDRQFAVHWSMEKPAYRRTDAWRWPEAFRQALSIELGSSLPLLERETFVFPKQHTERVRPGKAVDLAPFQPFEGDLVDKARLFCLTEFFRKDSREAKIAWKLFDQMVRTKQQERWDDTELILSTALEGTLRSLDGAASSDREWQLDASLARFRGKYLSRDWRIACTRAFKAFEHLRHRTAHPEWMLDVDAERSESFRELQFLSRFYGYMILALARFPNLQPVFGGKLMAPVPPAPPPSSTTVP